MIVIPAIDLVAGKAVRLAQGDFSTATVYDDDPLAVVTRFVQAGAKRVHVVDLDGAREGRPVQRELVATLARRARDLGGSVQTGGGIRDGSAVTELMDAGVDAVVVGTLATRDPALTEGLCARHRGRVIVAVDERDGRVAVSGWREDSGRTVLDLARDAQAWGAAGLLHTDVTRDGMRVGPAVEATATLQRAVDIPVYASGGVGSLDDLDACARAGIAGVVLGRALYEGAFSIEEALARC